MIRELDARISDGIYVRLLWHSDNGRVSITVDDAKTGEAFELLVRDGERALAAGRSWTSQAAPSERRASIRRPRAREGLDRTAPVLVHGIGTSAHALRTLRRLARAPEPSRPSPIGQTRTPRPAKPRGRPRSATSVRPQPATLEPTHPMTAAPLPSRRRLQRRK